MDTVYVVERKIHDTSGGEFEVAGVFSTIEKAREFSNSAPKRCGWGYKMTYTFAPYKIDKGR